MANEYRTTLTALEALDTNVSRARTSLVGLETCQVDDAVTGVRTSLHSLEVLRTIDNADSGNQHFATVDFRAEGRTTFGAFQIAHSLSIRFRSELGLGLQANPKNPICAPPAFKSWVRIAPPAEFWECITVAPAEECEGIDNSSTDVLAYVDGHVLIDLISYRLRFIA